MAGSSFDAAFEWGVKEVGTSSSYVSMLYKGVRYRLYDCVFCNSGMETKWVGKLMRLFEDESGVKKVRIRWFFQPYELPPRVLTDTAIDDALSKRELFIAVGPLKGVENENVVNVIQKKAKVLCTAGYGINPVPPQALIGDADYVFCRAYDVCNRKLVKIANIDGRALREKFYNKLEWIAQVEKLEAFTSEGSISSTTSSSTLKDTNLVRKQILSRPPVPIVARAKKKKKF